MRAIGCLVLAACTQGGSNGDVTGPYSGSITRFAVDRIRLPTDSAMAKVVADDLNGDGTTDNLLGALTGVLAGQADLSTHGPDMIAAGAIASSLELHADDLVDDPTVGATYFGVDGARATEMGGTLSGGIYASNRTRTTAVPGIAILRLPVFADAAVSTIELDAMELDLASDGNGGFDAIVRGGVTSDALAPVIFAGVSEMIARAPDAHWALADLTDGNHDGQITADEVASSPSIRALVTPDIAVRGVQLVSFGFQAHVVPCDSGTCSTATAIDYCHDGVTDNGETDLDCGGSCGSCPAGARCTTPNDCASRACDGGLCRAPSCSDGVRDGLETDVDCGWNCARCASGRHCFDGRDCTTSCVGATISKLGTCK